MTDLRYRVTLLRRWLHTRGVHRFCRPIVEYDFSKQVIFTKTAGRGLEIDDVTNQNGTRRVVGHR